MGSGVPGDRQLYRLAAIQKAASVDAAVAWGRVLSQNHSSLLDGERRASGCKALIGGALLDCNKTIYFEDSFLELPAGGNQAVWLGSN